MGLTNVLNSANLGLRVTQAGLDVVARNIANADAPGYTRKVLDTSQLVADNLSIGVESLGVVRQVDAFLQMQIRSEVAAYAAADVRSEFLTRVSNLLGAPGAANALDTLMSDLSASLQQLTTAPDSYAARDGVVSSAQALAQQLNELSRAVQDLRQVAENAIAQAVDDINNALRELGTINQQLRLATTVNADIADLLDERDKFLDQLAEYLDINVTERSDGSVIVVTKSGNVLLQEQPVQLLFDQRGDIDATSLYATDPAERGVGTILLQASGGHTIDLIHNGILSNGRLGAYIEMRDKTLVEAQAQLDELAHALASTFSSKQVGGTAVTSGAQSGFDLDISELLPGNTITLNYTETPAGVARTVTIVRVDDPSKLPLSDTVTPQPGDTVIGIDFSNGVAAAAAAIQAALGSGFTVANPSGSILRILDDGAAATTDIDGLSALVTATDPQDGGLQVPLFVDAGYVPYSNSLDDVAQKIGFAGRITVNPLIVQDNELLVRYAADTPLGDASRPLELAARLTEREFVFSPATGIGREGAPFRASVADFAARIIDQQASRAEQAQRNKAAREVVVAGLQERFKRESGVDIDVELNQLITLQNAFAANARVMQAANEMMKLLMQVI